MAESLPTNELIPSWVSAAHQEFSKGAGAKFESTRAAALNDFLKSGFPSSKHEAWKYTNLSPLLRQAYRVAMKEKVSDLDAMLAPYLIADIGTRLLFVNGEFQAVPSKLAQGLSIQSFRDLGDVDTGAIAATNDADKNRNRKAFRSLNSAFLGEGVLIQIDPRGELTETIQIVHLVTASNEPRLLSPRVRIVAGEGSSVRVIESFVGLSSTEYITNAATDFVLEQEARAKYVKLIEEGSAALHVGDLEVSQGAKSHFEAHTFCFSGGTIRNEVEVSLNGERAEAGLSGLTVLRSQEHVDNHLVVRHVAPHCESRELYKGVYGDRAHGVFSGTIEVSPGAQKTNAYQSNKSILLSNEALSDSMPQLKIWADDVKCSHGATVGQLDEDALFYLRARGIPERVARGMLIRAFTGEVYSAVENKSVLAYVEKRLSQKLEQLGIGGEHC